MTLSELEDVHLLMTLSGEMDLTVDDVASLCEIETNYQCTSGLRSKSKFIPHGSQYTAIDLFMEKTLHEFFKLQDNYTLNHHYKDNLSRLERLALSNLKQDPSIIIREADKGGNIVVMNRANYVAEIREQLKDENCYKKVKTNPLKEISLNILEHLCVWKEEGLIEDSEYKYLNVSYPMSPFLYTLPKIHKDRANPPGRPIVSSIGSVTEHMSEFVDGFIKPLVVNLPSYVRDTTDILNKLQDFKWEDGMILATLDVVGLYTCIEMDKGIQALEHFLGSRSASLRHHSKMLIQMSQLILKNNYFLFEDEWFHQIRGTAMGSRFAPSYANLFMGWYEREHAWSRRAGEWMDLVVFWARFIDDILIIWRGTSDDLKKYLHYLNINDFNVKLTMNQSTSSIEYLDVTLTVVGDKINSTLFRKATATNSILRADSFHPGSVIGGIPYGEMVRTRRNCSRDEDYTHELNQLKLRLSKRGYAKKDLARASEKVSKIDRATTLLSKKRELVRHKLSFVTAYCVQKEKIRQALSRNWTLLKGVPGLSMILDDRPAITFKKCPTIRDKVSTNYIRPIKKPTTDWLSTQPKGFYTCGSCVICSHGINKTKTFSFNGSKLFHINDFINCNSVGIIYVIICSCDRVYIGSTKRPLKTRMQEHRRAIMNRDTRSPLYVHMEKEHGANLGFKFHGIQKVPQHVRGGNWELRIRQTEARWIIRCRSMTHGLNIDSELHYFLA
ncbi:uncharacterized protein LOC144756435 [Lissotriton helveticus]